LRLTVVEGLLRFARNPSTTVNLNPEVSGRGGGGVWGGGGGERTNVPVQAQTPKQPD